MSGVTLVKLARSERKFNAPTQLRNRFVRNKLKYESFIVIYVKVLKGIYAISKPKFCPDLVSRAVFCPDPKSQIINTTTNNEKTLFLSKIIYRNFKLMNAKSQSQSQCQPHFLLCGP